MFLPPKKASVAQAFAINGKFRRDDFFFISNQFWSAYIMYFSRLYINSIHWIKQKSIFKEELSGKLCPQGPFASANQLRLEYDPRKKNKSSSFWSMT